MDRAPSAYWGAEKLWATYARPISRTRHGRNPVGPRVGQVKKMLVKEILGTGARIINIEAKNSRSAAGDHMRGGASVGEVT